MRQGARSAGLARRWRARWGPGRLPTHVVAGGHRRERAAGASGPGIAQRLAPAGDAGEQHCVGSRCSSARRGGLKRRLWECGGGGQDQRTTNRAVGPPRAALASMAATSPNIFRGCTPLHPASLIDREDKRANGFSAAAGEGAEGNLRAAGAGRPGGRAGGRAATAERCPRSFRSGSGAGQAGAGYSAAALGAGAAAAMRVPRWRRSAPPSANAAEPSGPRPAPAVEGLQSRFVFSQHLQQ